MGRVPATCTPAAPVMPDLASPRSPSRLRLGKPSAGLLRLMGYRLAPTCPPSYSAPRGGAFPQNHPIWFTAAAPHESRGVGQPAGGGRGWGCLGGFTAPRACPLPKFPGKRGTISPGIRSGRREGKREVGEKRIDAGRGREVAGREMSLGGRKG